MSFQKLPDRRWIGTNLILPIYEKWTKKQKTKFIRSARIVQLKTFSVNFDFDFVGKAFSQGVRLSILIG